MIGDGDTVVCIGDAGRYCMPGHRPEIGEVYTVTSTSEMDYGIGCTLQGMDPRPFRGYLLFVDAPYDAGMAPGWYFRRLEPIRLAPARTLAEA